jgi:pimeloyl-ACP methyl ester carboxylesterase
VQSNFVQTSDIRMHYLQQGTGEPVVLIHGFPETSYEWRKQFQPLVDAGFAVFAPDTRGFGQTDKPGTRATRHLLAGDIIRFLDALGLEKAHVVGHDWGGIIAFKVAIDWPERVNRLALLDTLCTVWAPGAIHGYWFKAQPYPEELFRNYHRQFIETVMTGSSAIPLPPRPLSPWQGRPSPAAAWATQEDVEHYAAAFADPASHAAAISYYRYALPFHVVTPDDSAPHGEAFRHLGEHEVARMWLHEEGLEKHPLYPNFMDYGPEDRHKTFPNPTLWMYGTYLARSRGTEGGGRPADVIPTGNPFVEQFPRYFPDLRARRVDAGHFFPEEAPDATNEALVPFLQGRL